MAVPSQAAASDDDGWIVTGRRLVHEDLAYGDAILHLTSFLSRVDLTDEDRLEALLLLAISHVAQGSLEAARVAFEQMLRIHPGYEVDRTLSPKIRQAFAEARRLAPRIRLSEPHARQEGPHLVLGVRLEDVEDRVATVNAYVRLDGEAFETIRLSPALHADQRAEETTFEGATAASLAAVDAYFVARTAGGREVGRLADALAPITLLPVGGSAAAGSGATPSPSARPEGAPVYARWWFWAIVGAGAVAIASSVMIHQARQEPAPGTLPVLRLPLLTY